MNTKIIKILLSLFILTIAFFATPLRNVYAAPINKFPISVTQPDGTIVNLFASGDEYYNWLDDDQGYTVMKDPNNGFYVYADLVDDVLIPTKNVAGKVDPTTVISHPHLNISPAQVTMIRQDFENKTKQSESVIRNAPTSGTLNNLVIFIHFSDEAEFTDATSKFTSVFNDKTAGANSLRNYYSEVSYNTLTVNSTLLPTPGTTVISYKDGHARNYYQPYNAATNTVGYTGGDNGSERTTREHTLLRDAISYVNGLGQFPNGTSIDADNDGVVDSLTFIVSGAPGGWSSLLWPHEWSLYTYQVKISGKAVDNYAFQLNDWIETGVLAHEMFHVLGAPDLYHYSQDGLTPVGGWDLMEYDSNPPQHMSCFMKFQYGHWINTIPQLPPLGAFTLNPLTSSTNNCKKIISPNSTTEYFVVEYRSTSGSTFESSLPGSGLLVYRINSTISGNAGGPPDEVYIYRPDGTSTNNGSVNLANFSSNAGRTAINDSSNPSSFLSNGDKGGLDIRNIGSSNSTISFEIGYVNILSPVNIHPVNAGTNSNPTKVSIQIESIKGLPKSAFSVLIGGKVASIITMVEASGVYTLEVMPPAQSSNGLFDLVVSARSTTGSITGTLSDTEVGSINYSGTNNVDVDLVIDRSGSMGGTPMSSAIDAAKQFVDLMQTGDMVGVVSFDDVVETNYPLTTIQSSSAASIFSDDMESGSAKWIATSPWALSTDSAYSGSYAWTDSPGGNYSNYMNIPLQIASPIYISPGMSTPVLDFWQKYNIESGYDFGYVEISTNSGTTWTTLTSYSGTNMTWNKAEVNLSSYKGQTVLLRFRFYSDYSITYDGWYIDDVSIRESNSDTKTDAKSAIDALYARNNTSIGGGLQTGNNQLSTLGNPTQPWAMVLLTDGWENTAPWVTDVLPAIKASKTVVHTIGLGSSADQALLMDIAAQTGGTYSYAPGPDQLSEIYNSIIGTVSNRQTLFASSGTAQQGVTDQANVIVDSTISDATFSVSWANSSSSLDLTLTKPDGSVINSLNALLDSNIEYVAGPTYKYYRVHSPTLVSGVWTINVSGGTILAPQKIGITSATGEPYTTRVSGIGNLTMHSAMEQSDYRTFEPLKLSVTLSDTQPILGGTVIASINNPSLAAATIKAGKWIKINGDTIPDPATLAHLQPLAPVGTIQLFDDGLHGDGAANDGVYANRFYDTGLVGTYVFDISASGTSNVGDPFTRQSQLTTYIAQNPNSVVATIGGILKGSINLQSGGLSSPHFAGMVDGPVRVTSTDGLPIFSSQRATSGESYNEVMGVPTGQLTTDYWFPAYDHSYIPGSNTNPMRMWVLIGNASTTQAATVSVTIGGTPMIGSPFSVPAGGRITPRWIGTKGGPVHVVSTNGVNIFTSERVFTYPTSSFNEILGFPASQLTSEYWFPYYDSVSMTNSIQVANTNSKLAANVDIYVGAVKQGSYSIPGNATITVSYPNLVDGPVRVVSTEGIKVIASQVTLSGPNNAFNEVLGYPYNQFTTEYWYPAYDHAFIKNVNTDLMRMWVLVGNPSTTQTATVDIYIAGVKTADSPFSIPPGGRVTPRWMGVTDGPVRVVSTNGVPIFTSERVFTYPSSVFNEMMGFPLNQMSTEYWFPYYDSINMSNDILVSRP